MDTNFYSDEFEQLIKEKSDQFRMYPSRRVWHSIYNNLHPSRRWPSYAMSILLLTSLSLIGYLNTNDNSTTGQLKNKYGKNNSEVTQNLPAKNNNPLNYTQPGFEPTSSSELASADLREKPSSDKTVVTYTGISENTNKPSSGKNNTQQNLPGNKSKKLVKPFDANISSSQLFTDVAVGKKNNHKKVNSDITSPTNQQSNEEYSEDNKTTLTEIEITPVGKTAVALPAVNNDDKDLLNENDKSPEKNQIVPEKNVMTLDEKAWIENFALHNSPKTSKWKDRLDFEFYATPAVNYRKLTTDSKGSSTPFATTGDINRSISQKPGLGIEAGFGLSYSFIKNLRLKAGIQFNYTNYNINADKTNHPILTTILLIDPVTGYSYPAARTSSISNAYDANALQPVTLHNRTYQISIPVGFAYKLSSHKNVEWFAGATVQPSYIFGGNAHLISADLKSYISDPSSIRHWNLNLGFETYMNYKVGAYNLQVGPQLRYQLYSTYGKNVALIEKPYAVGLKIGIIKGF